MGLILLAFLLGISYYVTDKRGFPQGLRTVLALSAAGTLVIGIGLTAGLGTLTSTSGGTVGGPIYSVTASAGDPQNSSNMVVDNIAHTIQVQVQCTSSCASFSYGSGTWEGNFTIGRSDTGTQDVTTPVALQSVGLVPKSDGSGTTFPIVALNVDSTYKSDWEKGPNASPVVTNKATTVLLPGGGSTFARVNVTWNINAVAQQTAFQTSPVVLKIADQTWTVTEILTIKV